MTSTDSVPTEAPRERGWGRVLGALALVLLMAGSFAPIGSALGLLVPVIAALMIAAWRQGGSAFTAVAWTGLVVWTLARTPGIRAGFTALETGYALLLATAFGVAALVRPAARFFPRAVAAVAATLVLALGLVATVGPGLPQTAELVRRQYAATATAGAIAFQRVTEASLKGDRSEAAEQARAEARAFADAWQEAAPRIGVTIAPALLALESLAVLALGWALFHRLSRTRVGPPLGRLADFRFADAMVWGVIVGLVLAVTPGLAPLRGVSANLLVFFGALFAVRGIGVLWYFAAPGPVLTVLAAVAGAVFATVVVPTAACLGLSDIWIDWRRRATAPTP